MPSGIYPRTEYHKNKLKVHRNYTRTEAMIQKIIENNKKWGIKFPSRKGTKHSQLSIIKMSKAVSGEKHHNWGKHLSEKTRKKISESHIKIREKHWNWKGGTTNINHKIRDSIKYKQWRQDVFIRDDFTCQKCGQIGKELNVHHKKPFHKLLEEVKKYLPLLDLYAGAMIYTPLWDLDNGITLCEKCHKKVVKQK